MSNNRQARERAPISMKQVALEHKSGFSRTALEIPDGVSMFALKKPGTYRIDIIPFIAGEGNPNFEPGQPAVERTYYTHAKIGADEDVYVCSQKTYNALRPLVSSASGLRPAFRAAVSRN